MGSSPLTRGKLPVAVGSTVSGRLIPAHAGKTPSLSSSSSSSSAHPRSRGENRTLWPGNHAGVGSSPLTRGKRGACGWAAGRTRLIPAHAGKTRRGMPTTRSRPAHPRSRGENPRRDRVWPRHRGSSPLTRGKPTRSMPVYPLWRLIPAHAGKTPSQRSHCTATRAHPRSRGENLTRSMYWSQGKGSSPLTRGKQRIRL